MAIQHETERSGRPERARRQEGRARELTAANGASGGADERFARGLGWFSIGLGIAEIVAPGRVARLSGVRPRSGFLRSCGLRELASGIAILRQRRPAPGLWSRVAGDALDLSALAVALASPRSRRGRAMAATAAVAGIAAVDVLCAMRLSRTNGATADTENDVRLRTAITIDRPAQEVYRFWREFTNLPRVMRHLQSVQMRGERRSHWVARGPGGMRLEWDSEIVDDRPGELIAWRSLPGGHADTEGAVRFVPAPGGRGTEVHLDMSYRVPGGWLVGRLFGGAAPAVVSEDLRPLKQLLESGEVPTTHGSPSARARHGGDRGRTR